MRKLALTGYFLVTASGFAAIVLPLEVWAARSPLSVTEFADRENVFEWSPLVRDIQKLLIEFSLLDGAADGRIDKELRQAVRRYQREHGLTEDGDVSRELLRHMDRVGRPASLKNRLAEARRQQTEQAHTALMANPETRDLVKGSGPSPSSMPEVSLDACIQTPRPRCLINEALQAMHAIEQDDYRDWALREIIRAQARNGMLAELRVNIRRISDVRLIVVALREAAVGLLKAGQVSDAKRLAYTIPDDWHQARALAEIVGVESRTPLFRPTLARLSVILAGLEDRIAAGEITAQIAIAIAENGWSEDASALLKSARDSGVTNRDTNTGRTFLTVIAGAYARIGETSEALAILRDTGEIGRDHIALAEAAGQIAEQNLPDVALGLAGRLRTPRLHILALSKIAAAQARLGDVPGARRSLQRAMNASLDISRPIAADSALAEIAEAWSGLPDHEQALAAIEKIKSRPLRAQSLWKMTASTRNDPAQLAAKASAATETIESSFDRASVLIHAAIIMAERDRADAARAAFNEAVQNARTIQAKWWRARIFSRLASAISEL